MGSGNRGCLLEGREGIGRDNGLVDGLDVEGRAGELDSDRRPDVCRCDDSSSENSNTSMTGLGGFDAAVGIDQPISLTFSAALAARRAWLPV
jgi:hypothetical protein